MTLVLAANADNDKQKKRQKAAFLPYLCREVCATVCLSVSAPRYFSFAGGGRNVTEVAEKCPTRDASPPLVVAFPIRFTGKKASLKPCKGLLCQGIAL